LADEEEEVEDEDEMVSGEEETAVESKVRSVIVLKKITNACSCNLTPNEKLITDFIIFSYVRKILHPLLQ
jgi:hypothetical protein